MTKPGDNNVTDDTQDSLVQALESIKGLLEKSESKLSQARESIALANSSSKKAKAAAEAEEIPVLSEVIMPGHEVLSQPDFDINSAPAGKVEAEIPVLDEIPTLAETLSAGLDSQQVFELIDAFQQRIKPLFKETISNCSLLKLEEELNKIIENELVLLRAEIKQLED